MCIRDSNKALYTVFSEPPVDDIYEEPFDYGDAQVFTVEFLPGQFDPVSYTHLDVYKRQTLGI